MFPAPKSSLALVSVLDDPTDAVNRAALALTGLVEDANQYADAARSDNTRRAYRKDWETFEEWCKANSLAALPASGPALAIYLTYLANEGLKVATIQRALSAISQAHKMANVPSPRGHARVAETMRGIRRTLGVAPVEKAPVLVDLLRRMVDTVAIDETVGVRDRALLVLGFAGGFRRSELVSLNVEDVKFTNDGLEVVIRRSKTDQEGAGRKIGIPYGSVPTTCPVRVLRAWLDVSTIATGAIFRAVDRNGHVRRGRLTAQVVALVVKRYAAGAGVPAWLYAGHSLRAGLVTAAAKAGKSERAIMARTGHRSIAMVRRYIRDGELFNDDNATAGVL